MRIGVVCPYAWDIPGGVQNHVRDLAEHLIGLGHEISVLAPADDDAILPEYVTHAGRAVVIPNGVDVEFYERAEPKPEWQTQAGEGGTMAFIGRINEPRKGLPTLLEAFPQIAAARPGVRLLVLGGGDIEEAQELLPDGV